MKKTLKVMVLVASICTTLQGCKNTINNPQLPMETPIETTTVIEVAVVTEETIDPALFHDVNSLYIFANKSNPLPEGYEPSDLVLVKDVLSTRDNWTLRKPCYDAYVTMVNDALEDGVEIVCGSAYRSAAYQEELYNYYAAKHGKEAADTFSSRPGYSDHQTGLCVDVVQGYGGYDGYNYSQNFKNCDIGIWMYENAHKYGFVLRYPEGKEDITGYVFEPWHYRYVGEDIANKMYEISPDLTMEEYFDVSGGKEYKD